MNERIKKLIEEATTEERDGFQYFDKEKFAELIVRECATLIPAEQSHAPNGQPILKIFQEHFEISK
jgi:hypothetical protein